MDIFYSKFVKDAVDMLPWFIAIRLPADVRSFYRGEFRSVVYDVDRWHIKFPHATRIYTFLAYKIRCKFESIDECVCVINYLQIVDGVGALQYQM